MKRVVLDTNVLISATVFPGSLPDRLVHLVLDGTLTGVTSPPLLEEYGGVLMKKFGFTSASAGKAKVLYQAACVLVEPRFVLTAVRQDPADNRVLECAVAGGAEAVVTGDRRHLLPLREFRGIRIMTAAQCLSLLSIA